MTIKNTMTVVLSGDSIIMRDITLERDAQTSEMLEILQSADVAFTNLEVLPNNFEGDPALESGGTHLAAHPRVLDYLLHAGFNLMACANNHSLDYSISGLVKTIEELEDRGIPFAGIGRNLSEARMPAYLDTENGTVSMIACSSTFAKGQEAAAQRDDLQGRPGLNPLHYTKTLDVTQDQYDTIKQIATDLGVEQQRKDKIQMGFGFPPDDPALFPFLDHNFRVAETPKLQTAPKSKDMADIEKWIAEAKGRSDVVISSVHAHEPGMEKEDPADFLIEFAHRCIDAGADMVVGHGPHLLRGIEIYNGKPIFYSLGNFVGQNELVYKLPADSYDSFRVNPDMTPSAIFRLRSENDTKSFPADPKYWQTVLPVCEYDGDTLLSLKLVPISLGHGSKSYDRGRPKLASEKEGESIIRQLQKLSKNLNTTILDDGTVVLEVTSEVEDRATVVATH